MADCGAQTKYNSKVPNESESEIAMRRLPKRLAYLLRYGAVKEGLEVDDNGFVELDELLKVPLLQEYRREVVADNIRTSMGSRLIHRYNWLEKDGKVYVRASYHRNFEKSPYHHGTKVCTLFECAMAYIVGHLDDYDLQDFPDEYIIRDMIHRLKRQKKLSAKILKALLVPTLTSLDLEDVFLTNNALRAVWTQCPRLTAVSLKNCGYIVTDSMLAQFTKNLPELRRLNLCNCNHLTSKCLTILVRNLPHLQVLNIARVHALTHKAVLDFIRSASELKYLDVYYLKTNPEEFCSLMTAAQETGLNLVLRDKGCNGQLAVEENVEVKITATSEDNNEDSSTEGSQVELSDEITDELWDAVTGNVWYESCDYTYTEDQP